MFPNGAKMKKKNTRNDTKLAKIDQKSAKNDLKLTKNGPKIT